MAKKPSLVDAATRPGGRARSDSMEHLLRSIQQPNVEWLASPQTLGIDQLTPGRYQPRQAGAEPDAALLELAESIRVLGVIEPVAVRPMSDSPARFEILAGHRRWQAARMAGLADVPVIVHVVDDRVAAAMALVENLQRQDLNPLETATALKRLKKDFKLTQDQLGRLLGMSKSAISRMLGLLDAHEDVQRLLGAGQLDLGHAKVLMTLDLETQAILANQAAANEWSVRELEKRKAALASGQIASTDGSMKADRDPNLQRLETMMGDWLAAPVRLKTRKTGEGSIIIRFNSADECDGILKKIGFNLGEF